jgi:hypothetical protein
MWASMKEKADETVIMGQDVFLLPVPECLSVGKSKGIAKPYHLFPIYFDRSLWSIIV